MHWNGGWTRVTADGGKHLHAYGRWADRYCTRNKRTFDLNGHHPNIQPVRNTKHVIEYIKKGGDYFSDVEDTSGSCRYADLVGAATEKDFWEIVSKSYPRDYVLHLERLNEFCRHRFGNSIQNYEGRFGRFNITDPMKGWVENELGNNDRPKSLWLVGPSRIGKTEWARSLGNHIYWNGSIDLGTWSDEAKYAIFDDFTWNFFPYKKQFVGAQSEFVVTDKYRRKKTIRWGKPSIMVWNPDNDPWDSFNTKELDWYKLNTIRVVLSECLFTAENVWVEI